MSERETTEAFNEFLVVVGYTAGPPHPMIAGRLSADVGLPCPDPLPTSEEMQAVAYAAKMAMIKVLRKRKKERRNG